MTFLHSSYIQTTAKNCGSFFKATEFKFIFTVKGADNKQGARWWTLVVGGELYEAAKNLKRLKNDANGKMMYLSAQKAKGLLN